MNKVVIARLVGGIGNQLFIYASARRLAEENKAKLVLDTFSGFEYDKKYQQYFHLNKFNIKNIEYADKNSKYILSRTRRYLLRIFNKLKPFSSRNFIAQKGRDFDSRFLNLKFKNKLYLEGYWQSELYFKSIENLIRSELVINPPKDIINQQLYQLISNTNSIAIHLRYFDNAESRMFSNEIDIINGHSFLEEYYIQAIQIIKNRISNPHFYIFSDKPDFSKLFAEKNNINYTVIDNNIGYENAYADLFLMSNCKHFINANSTFSWWGAWLSIYNQKTVLVPGKFNNKALDAWSFKGLIPEGWIELNLFSK